MTDSFHVRLSDEPGPGHVISGAASAEDAAMQFLELRAPQAAEVEEVRVTVTGGAGHSHCFVIRMDIHRIEPC